MQQKQQICSVKATENTEFATGLDINGSPTVRDNQFSGTDKSVAVVTRPTGQVVDKIFQYNLLPSQKQILTPI